MTQSNLHRVNKNHDWTLSRTQICQEPSEPLPSVEATMATSTPLMPDTVSPPLRDAHSPIAPASRLTEDTETPRKASTPSNPRPSVPPKPDFSRDSRAVSEPVEASPAPGVLSGGEQISLPPLLNTGAATDSPMPELLSLKDRLKLFEKEIDDQNKIPEPKKDRKFSFLSQDEVDKMKEEEAKRIASMTAINMEAFESLTSQISTDEEVLTQVRLHTCGSYRSSKNNSSFSTSRLWTSTTPLPRTRPQRP